MHSLPSCPLCGSVWHGVHCADWPKNDLDGSLILDQRPVRRNHVRRCVALFARQRGVLSFQLVSRQPVIEFLLGRFPVYQVEILRRCAPGDSARNPLPLGFCICICAWYPCFPAMASRHFLVAFQAFKCGCAGAEDSGTWRIAWCPIAKRAPWKAARGKSVRRRARVQLSHKRQATARAPASSAGMFRDAICSRPACDGARFPPFACLELPRHTRVASCQIAPGRHLVELTG